MMETKRLIIRPWQEADATVLYKYASDPDVGPMAGWQAHSSEEESLEILKNFLIKENIYAICLKETMEPIGSIGLHMGEDSCSLNDNEPELGYWIAKPYWGQGLAVEAAKVMMKKCFEELGARALWVCYYEKNSQSKRVVEKLGFRYVRTVADGDTSLGYKLTEVENVMSKEEYINLIK